MMLSPGTRLGPYEILEAIGAGGMGEVYKARDTRLGRDVALKVLAAHVASRPEFRQRFEREARAVASLNHPHICQLYDIGREGETDYLVMEYLDGEPLSARLRKGALPPAQTVELARQIADALGQAHRKGVVHRDLKPGNIMLTRAGAKLLDFGLAKTSPVVEGSDASTLTSALTSRGHILGTLQYMAPEQLQGKEADPRSDIFALGGVLYEAATGRRAFEASDPASLIAAILERDPPPASLQSLTPPALDRLIRVCLNKDPDQRWQNAHDLLPQLRWMAEGAADSKTADALPRTARLWAAAAVALALALIAVGYLYLRKSPLAQEGVQFTFPAQLGGPLGSEVPSVSPDGRHVAFWSKDAAGRELLWVRSLDSSTARPLEGTEGAAYHFWSPDSRSVAFFAEQKIKRISLSGGPPQPVASCASSGLLLGAAWGSAGDILLAPYNRGPLYRVAAAGGPLTPLTALEESLKVNSHRWPHFLPGGRQFLYLARSAVPDANGVYMASISAPRGQKLVTAQSSPAYAPSASGKEGYLLFVQDGNLVAKPFDPARGVLGAESVAVAENVYWVPPSSFTAFSVSGDGRVLAYRAARTTTSQLGWYDRAGKRLAAVGPPGQYSGPRLSPDARRVALSQPDPRGGNRDIWIVELSSGLLSRLTRHPANEWAGVWSPNGDRIAMSSDRLGRMSVYERSAVGGGEESLIHSPESNTSPHDWSSDGRWLVIGATAGQAASENMLLLAATGDQRKAIPLATSEFTEHQGAFSPDSHLLAYISDESGRFEVYVRSLPGASSGPRGQWRVSAAGGIEPRWRRDGREIYYLAPDKMMMAVEVKSKETFEAGPPRPLFRSCGYSFAQPLSYTYDVAPDGQRFLVNCLVEETASAPVTVLVNWQAALGSRGGR